MRSSLLRCMLGTVVMPFAPAVAESALEVETTEAIATGERKSSRESSSGGGGELPLERIQVTATRMARPNFDVSGAVTVIGSDEIHEQAPLTVADYLRAQPGTYVQATTPGQAIPIVRGLKGSEVLHMVDGFRMNTAFFRNSPNQYFALADAQNADQIEVVRGPSATLYGSDAMGGVVQILTPEERFAGDEWRSRGKIRAQYTSGDLSRIGRVSAAAGKDGISISAGMTSQHVGLRELGGDGGRLPNSDFSARAADAKLLVTPVDGHELMVSVQYLKQPSTPRVDELIAGYGQTQPGSAEFYFEPQDRLFAQARYVFESQQAWVDRAEFHLGNQEVNDDRRTRDSGSRNRDTEQNASRLRGVTASFNKQLGRHGLVWGAEAYYDTVDSAKQRLNIDSGVSSVRAPRFPDGSTMNSYAAYLSDSIDLSPRWQLDLGGRYSRFDIELPANEQGAGVSLSPDDLTGNAGLAFKLTEQMHLVTNLGRGFRAPNIFDLGVFGDRPNNRFAVPNADLVPESVVAWDVGIKWDQPGWQAEAFVWKSNYSDKITTVETGELLANGRIVVTNRNVTDLSLWGVEAGLRRYFEQGTQAYAVINYTRGEEQYAGDRYAADRIPPLNGRLGLLHYLRQDISLDTYAIYAARQDRLSPRDATDPRINPAGTAGWNSLNARLAWDFSADATLGLRLENLADRRYREHGSGADEMGRSATVTLDWTF